MSLFASTSGAADPNALSEPTGLSGSAHVFLILGTVASVGFILVLLRRRHLRGKYAMLWTGLGLFLLVLAIFPGLLATVSEWIGVHYAPALFLVVAVGFLLVVVIHFSWELSRLEDRSRTLAEEVGLLRTELARELARQEHASGSGQLSAPSGT
ncbi:MAG: DUF2304 domain-containing protein [Acidimicrobiales bacterium]|nr:DUF2304 domain-containing protein [Acidimicrobiales bacterium]